MDRSVLLRLLMPVKLLGALTIGDNYIPGVSLFFVCQLYDNNHFCLNLFLLTDCLFSFTIFMNIIIYLNYLDAIMPLLCISSIYSTYVIDQTRHY